MEIDVALECLMIEWNLQADSAQSRTCLAEKLSDNGLGEALDNNKVLICFPSPHSSGRRVHITKTTLDYLGDKFEVEPGNGASREQYLADHKVESYLIVPPKVSCVWEPELDGAAVTFPLARGEVPLREKGREIPSGRLSATVCIIPLQKKRSVWKGKRMFPCLSWRNLQSRPKVIAAHWNRKSEREERINFSLSWNLAVLCTACYVMLNNIP